MNSPKAAVVSDYDRTLACESDGFRIREDVSEAVNEFSRKHVFIVASGSLGPRKRSEAGFSGKNGPFEHRRVDG
jgi:hypothetical protein